ncbi:MAG TPA: hypothetical protein VLB12_16065, partial [Gemmatimonadales bacterium]|nr:hypothetical protein [Gemmatimonadales bacterium]
MMRVRLSPLILALALRAPVAEAQVNRSWGDELRLVPSPERMVPVAPRQLEPLDWPAPPRTTSPSAVR